MKEYWIQFKEWWSQLALREQRFLLVGAGILGILFIYLGIWSPLMDAVETKRKLIKSNQALLVFMQAADQELQTREKQSHRQTTLTSPVALLSYVQAEVKQAGLSESLTQLKQSTNEAIVLHFQKVNFDQSMRLLIKMVNAQNVVVSQLSITALKTPGIVNEEMTIKIK